MSPLSLSFSLSSTMHLSWGRNLACNWHPCKVGLNTCMAIQFVRGGVIKQMCVDAVLFGALSAVLKPGIKHPFAIKYPVKRSQFRRQSLPLLPIKLDSSGVQQHKPSPSLSLSLNPLFCLIKKARKMEKITYSRWVGVYSVSAGYILKLLRISFLAGLNEKNPLWSQIWRILAWGWRSGCWRYAQVSLTVHWWCCSELNSLSLSATKKNVLLN